MHPPLSLSYPSSLQMRLKNRDTIAFQGLYSLEWASCHLTTVTQELHLGTTSDKLS